MKANRRGGCLCRVMMIAGFAAQAVGFTPSVPGGRPLRASNFASHWTCPQLRRGCAASLSMLGAGTEDDTPHRNSTAPAAAGQAELEASVRALKTQLEERDATILHLLSEVTNLQETLKSQSESPLPPLPSQMCKRVMHYAHTHYSAVPSRASLALTDMHRRALEATLHVEATEEGENELLVKMMREMGLSDMDIAHVMRERDRIKPPKPGEVSWSKRGFSKRAMTWLGLHALE